MTIITESPKNILVEFLRNRLTDPRARAEATNTETFNGGATEYSLTPTSGNLSCITAITVTSVAQKKWKDYYIDFQNKKVIFFSTTASGTANVSITYKQGTSNWIYPDKPKESLSKESFPRISIMQIGGTAQRIGQYNAPIEHIANFQIDLWVKEGYVVTIGTKKYHGDTLSEYLALKIFQVIRQNVDDLYPIAYNVGVISNIQDLPFDVDNELYHKVFNLEMSLINMGEINDD